MAIGDVADAVGRGVEPKGDDEKARFATMVHWGYGTGWGAVRGLVAAVISECRDRRQ